MREADRVMGRLLFPLFLAAGVVCAQSPPAAGQVHHLEKRPVFRVDVVEKVTVAINYRHRGGSTTIAFRGTPLMPRAQGEAKVESKRGCIEIEAEFKQMRPAIVFGAEYLTFVMWAVTPEGRAANLGEILVNRGGSKLNVTTELQVFGLIVTAEPYFAVRRPSDLVVMENEVRKETKGKVEVIDAKYELLKRGQYEPLANPLSLTVDPRVPLELYQARNAVQIANSSGADRYAGDSFLKAERSLRQAEAYQARGAGKKPVTMLAREAVQTAEDARELAALRRKQERLARERKEAAGREARAKAAAEEEARLRAQAEAQRKAEAEQRAAAERREREKAEKAAAEQAKLEADLAAAREAATRAEEEAGRVVAMLQDRTSGFSQERARWEEERTRREAEDAERFRRLAELEKTELRVRLYSQFGRVLHARDTDSGLVVEIPGEMFEAGAPVLVPAAREKLAVVAGILLAHPGLMFRARESSRGLAQQRVQTVRAYLIERGLRDASSAGASPAEELPVVPAADADGRLAGGPVELIVVGEPIGIASGIEERDTSGGGP